MQKYAGVEKIISGGQTGADQGGLYFAKAVGIKTGGTAPYQYRTENGNMFVLLGDYFGLEQHKSFRYPPRTLKNVKDSDGTVIFSKENTPGTILTEKYCKEESKPCFIVRDIMETNGTVHSASAEKFVAWLKENKIKVLNVAGNRESVSAGIKQKVVNFLLYTIIGRK